MVIYLFLSELDIYSLQFSNLYTTAKAMTRLTDSHSKTQQILDKQMLEPLGLDSIEALIENVFAKEIRPTRALELGKGTESTPELEISQLASLNTPMRAFIGMGYYQNSGCALLVERIIANPLWHEPYIAHQAEICQGRLEALYNFQTMILSMTGMQQSCCPLQDEALAAVEAMIMMYRLRSTEALYQGRNMFFVDQNIFAQTLDVLLTYSEGLGIEIVCDNFDEYEFCGKEFGALIQYPASNGHIYDYDDFCAAAHSNSVLVCAAVDLLSLSLLKSPESWGADIVVGSAQRFGLGLNFGTTNAAFIATIDDYADFLPADRICKHKQENTYYVKHPKDSSVSTSESLSGIYTGLYAMYFGATGIYNKALHAHSYAHALGSYLSDIGYSLSTNQYFDTIEVIDVAAKKIEAQACKAGINVFCAHSDIVHISLDELTTLRELNALAEIFAKAAGAKHRPIKSIDMKISLLHDVQRTSPLLQEEIFNIYNSESELDRYIKDLEIRDLELTFRLRKANSLASNVHSKTALMRMSNFTDIHPFAPEEQCEGYAKITNKLEEDLARIAGLSGCSLQATSQSSALFAGFMLIRAYHQSRAAAYRNVVFIPQGSHPNKKQMAMMAGMKLVDINTTDNAEIDLKDLKYKAEYYSNELSCLVLETQNILTADSLNIREAIDIVHDHLSQVYVDCNNMNAMTTFTSAGYVGADLCVLDISQLFELAYRDRNCGLKAICMGEHLRAFMPTHPIVPSGGEEGITAIASSPRGMAILFPLVYIGLRTNKGQNIRKAVSKAILNANYMAKKLSSHFRILNTNTKGYVDSRVIIELDASTSTQDFISLLLEKGYYLPKTSHLDNAIILESKGSKREVDMLIEAVTACNGII